MDALTSKGSDICINNTLAIRNTRLLKAYVDADPRVSTMIFFVKHVRVLFCIVVLPCD